MNLSTLKDKVRMFCLRRLGGIDRVYAQQFAREFMQSNGCADTVMSEDYTRISGKTFYKPEDGHIAIAVAPWAMHCEISSCRFMNYAKPVVNQATW